MSSVAGMKPRVVAIAEEHIESFRRAVDCVARERRYLAFVEAPPLEQTRAFVLGNIQKGNPQFVALSDEEVVGWCDIVRSAVETHSHCGALGMGLLPAYRGKGTGSELMAMAIDAAWRRDFLRIELGVRHSNVAAINLYKKMGFVVEGVRRKAARLGEGYEDTLVMGLLKEHAG